MQNPAGAPKNTGLKRLIKASVYSYQGLVYAFKHEAAFRQEALAGVVLIALACWLDVTGVERALLILPVMLVLVVELLNTALEAVVDRIGLERHVLAGAAKDAGSAAVLLSLVTCVLMWALVLLSR